MSLNNSYNYGSQQQSRNANLDHIIVQSGPSGVQLDLSHLVSNNGNSQTQLHSTNSGIRLLQQHPVILPRPQAPPLNQQPQQQMPPKAKKPKEILLKTPLSLLNEICAKAKTLPIFEMEETGPVHNRQYNCSVKVDTQGFSCNASGTGKTKKEAKQIAAKSLLFQIDQESTKYLIPQPPKEEPVEPEATIIEVDPETVGNPVGDLNDLCTKLKRLPPEYEDVGEEGKPHERVYTIACKLGTHLVETGRGRSKKSAKKAAAHKVHKRVLELLANNDNTDSGTILADDQANDNIMEMLTNLTLVSKKDAKKINEGWKLVDWLTELRSRSGPKVELIKTDVEKARAQVPDPIKLMREVADEQNFRIEFSEMDSGDESLKTYLIGVSAGNQPVTVLMGSSAESKTQAKKVAAENFLEMLHTILRSK